MPDGGENWDLDWVVEHYIDGSIPHIKSLAELEKDVGIFSELQAAEKQKDFSNKELVESIKVNDSTPTK